MPEVVEQQKEAVIAPPVSRRFEIPVFADEKVKPEAPKEEPAVPPAEELPVIQEEEPQIEVKDIPF